MNSLQDRKPKVAHLKRDFVSSSLPPFYVASASPFKPSATLSAMPFSAAPFSAAPFAPSGVSQSPFRSLRDTQCHLVSEFSPKPAAKRHLLGDMFSKGVRA